MKRIASLAAVTIMAVGSLSACGGGGYCDKLEEYDEDEGLSKVDATTEDGQDKLIEVLEDLEASAPDDLKDDYEVVLDGFTALREGNTDDVDQAKFEEAFSNIGENSQDDCDVDMGV